MASGAIGLRRALVFLAAQLAVGLVILLQLNPLCWALGVAILAVVFTYPLMKRVTYWPQLFLGIAFKWGAVMGWAAVTGAVAPAAVALYLGGIAWTLGYDTIYAHQDKEDDALIGVKSTALRLGAQTRVWLVGFYAMALAGIAGAAWLAGLAWPSFAVLALAGGHLVWQVVTVDLDEPAACLAVFKSNRLFGALVMGALALVERASLTAFIADNTAVRPVALVPELSLHTADESTDLAGDGAAIGRRRRAAAVLGLRLGRWPGPGPPSLGPP